MISPEVLRRYPFFAGLTHKQLVALAMTADESEFEAEHRFFGEGDILDAFYLLVEGDVGIVLEVPSDEAAKSVARQLTGEIQTSDVMISRVGAGEPFGWTAIAEEGGATAGAVAIVASKVLVFDKSALLEAFNEDPTLACAMLRHTLRIARQRMQDLRVECLAQSAA
jgi:CRP-like cAMP-binding protein